MRTQDAVKEEEINRYEGLIAEFKSDIASRESEIASTVRPTKWQKDCLEASKAQLEAYETILAALKRICV